MTINKKNRLLAIATIVMAIATLIGATLMNKSVTRVNAASEFAMENGASVRVSDKDEEAGLRFRAVIGDYDAAENAEYGMMIIRNDWLAGWNITDNYVPAVQAKFDALSVNNDEDETNDVAAPIQKVSPRQIGGKWTVTGSLVGILPENYDREFFGIAYKKVGETYFYAQTEVDGNAETKDNVRSISSVALKAMLDDSQDENNTTDALACFEKYTTSNGAKRTTSANVVVSEETADKDFTFLMKATNSNEAKASDVNLAVKNVDEEVTSSALKLNTESELDGAFTVESELVSDGWYKITVNSELFENGNTLVLTTADSVVIKDIDFVEHAEHALTVEKSFVQLLTAYKLNSETEKNKTEQYTHIPTVKDNGDTVKIGDYKLALAAGESDDWQLYFDNKNGKVFAADMPDGHSTQHSVSVKTRYAETTFIVRVSFPVYSASDLDFLSTISYYEKGNVENMTASRYLSGYYIFMNDIDYGKHTRNYILPIAAMSDEDNFITTVDSKNQWGYDMNSVISIGERNKAVSYYSIGWKDVLGLEEGTETVGEEEGKYLKNADGTKFAGINPNHYWFGGRIDGNGYAIKNAWFMYDVYMGVPNGSNSGLVGAGGAFVGKNLGVIENLELDIKTPNNSVQYVNGIYTQVDKQYNNQNTFGRLYENIKMYDISNSNVVSGLPYIASDNMANAMAYTAGVVLFNCATIQNVYYKAYVGGITGGNASTGTGALVIYNAKDILNCVVDRKIVRLEDNHHPKYNFTLAVHNDGGSVVKDTDSGKEMAGNVGARIQGCYSLVSCDAITTWNSTDYSHETKLPDNYMIFYKIMYAYFGTENSGENDPKIKGEVDEISKVIYTTATGESQTTGQEGQHSKLASDYARMIGEATENGNLSGSIWVLNSENNTVSLVKGIMIIG